MSRMVMAWAVALYLFGRWQCLGAPLIIDDFAYTNTVAARQAWVAVSAPPVAMATSGEWGTDQVMTLPCDFAVRNDRCYWDRTVGLNLAGFTDFALEVFAPDPGAISGFTLYFRSGAGWYGASASLGQTGWQTLRFSKSAFIPEGTPSGWDHINAVRLSPWKAASRSTYLAVRQLRAFTPPVMLVRDDLSSNPTIVQETIDRHVAWLGSYNVDCGVLSGTNVEAGLLAQCRLAILPYNENISAAAVDRPRKLRRGGRQAPRLLPPARADGTLARGARDGLVPGRLCRLGLCRSFDSGLAS